MKTLRFEDRDWIVNQFVLNDNGRVVTRDEHEAMLEFREVLQIHNHDSQVKAVRGVLNGALIGGLLLGLTVLLNGMI